MTALRLAPRSGTEIHPQTRRLQVCFAGKASERTTKTQQKTLDISLTCRGLPETCELWDPGPVLSLPRRPPRPHGSGLCLHVPRSGPFAPSPTPDTTSLRSLNHKPFHTFLSMRPSAAVPGGSQSSSWFFRTPGVSLHRPTPTLHGKPGPDPSLSSLLAWTQRKCGMWLQVGGGLPRNLQLI